MNKTKLIIHERFNGKQTLEDIFLSAFQSDNAQLVRDVSNSYTYDSEGNIITAKENGDQNSTLSYDDQNNLTSLTDAKNQSYSYTYDDEKHVTEAKSAMGTKVL